MIGIVRHLPNFPRNIRNLRPYPENFKPMRCSKPRPVTELFLAHCRMLAGSNVIEPAEHDARPQRVKESTMKYLLLIYANEANMQSASKADIDQMHAAYGAYTEAMTKAGVIVGGERLRPTASASTVRVADGKTKVLDGPYAEAKEQLGGYYMIDVPDLDAAISWAARCPGASHGTMEVRPIWPM
jgi:hypothetical protein